MHGAARAGMSMSPKRWSHESGGELGVALSGSAARALAQLGVLKVLEREGIPVSYLAGTSGGAVIGALFATSRDALEAEDRLLLHLRTVGTGYNIETFAALEPRFPVRALPFVLAAPWRALWRMSRPGRALIGGAEMRASLRALLGEATFADTRLPFATTALDLISGRRMIFAGGSLVDAVYASSAIPGLFEPLELDDHLLVDGGWIEAVPVNTCRHLGAIHTIAVDVPDAGVNMKPGPVGTALRADAVARHFLEELQLREADFVLRPRVAARHFADFRKPEELIAAGEEAARAALPEIAGVLERHRALFVRAPRRHPATAEVIV